MEPAVSVVGRQRSRGTDGLVSQRVGGKYQMREIPRQIDAKTEAMASGFAWQGGASYLVLW